ncbi:type II toxin-antitoxin system HicA family toxin [Dolichospermum compactum]|uniref:Type II toxin-antitoxin system HicA family toxin n=1 Tax=Dolichospermum compactum NIES-806 TaxID=1973481 RepID=A0A1Z4UY84_9CYAN|nr:hypothetical protein [Dolichospermum compactum]BAZ84207.1 hypothetical protein NIES806_03910 [Dolichospermum compactum NIES-806]
MPTWKAIKWRELVIFLKEAGFEGPYSGGKHQYLQDLRNWHIGRVRQISTICLFAGFMQSDAPYNRFLV